MGTVKMTKAPPGFTAAEDPETGQRFRVGVAVEGVSVETLARLETLDGFVFEETIAGAAGSGA